MRRLELLAPAKNLQCGIAAIDSGADAVYIGAQKFGARAAAGNSLEDIASLTVYAHQFGAKVYVTLNTLIYDDELDEMRYILEGICEIGVDAVLVQDMAMLELADGKNISLHASTQTDNRDKKKVGWLKSLGFSRVVLARELSLEEIREIHEAHPGIELEVFVHGALCVSYSGACYASEYCFKRSANRGECAQFCRMKFDLLDSEGTVLKHQSHLLSLKDLSLINHLEELADAGVVSFKIEGRLKDESYVRNVVAAYNQQLDAICKRRPLAYCRASIGTVEYAFKPDLSKTFNRGYTEYFFHSRSLVQTREYHRARTHCSRDQKKSTPDIYSPDTPKAIGEKIGVVESVSEKQIVVSSNATFAAGDGLCFFDNNNELAGFRVNRAEGCVLYPYIMPHGLFAGMVLYRNHDVAFEKSLKRNASKRLVPISLIFATTPKGFSLTAAGRGLATSQTEIDFQHQLAQKPQRANIINQLSRWGGTIYKVESIDIQSDAEKYFIPSSMLSALRKKVASSLALQNYPTGHPVAPYKMPSDVDLARTASLPTCGPLMECRHCLRYALGHCVKKSRASESNQACLNCRVQPSQDEVNGGTQARWKEPLFLRLSDGREFRLSFDCDRCLMLVFKHP